MSSIQRIQSRHSLPAIYYTPIYSTPYHDSTTGHLEPCLNLLFKTPYPNWTIRKITKAHPQNKASSRPKRMPAWELQNLHVMEASTYKTIFLNVLIAIKSIRNSFFDGVYRVLYGEWTILKRPPTAFFPFKRGPSVPRPASENPESSLEQETIIEEPRKWRCHSPCDKDVLGDTCPGCHRYYTDRRNSDTCGAPVVSPFFTIYGRRT